MADMTITQGRMHQCDVEGSMYADPRMEDIGATDYEHEGYLEQYSPFDPGECDPAKATRRMRKGLPTW